jgi:hypothetical protein
LFESESEDFEEEMEKMVNGGVTVDTVGMARVTCCDVGV